MDLDAIRQQGIDRAISLIEDTPRELIELGLDWYPSVHDQLRLWSLDTGYSDRQISAILAHYNRNQCWNASKTLCKRAVYTGVVDGMTCVRTAVKAIMALPVTATHADILPYMTNGSKTRHFYWACLNIAGCPCDRWIYDVWGVPQQERYYTLVESGVLEVAAWLGAEPRHTEAVLWLARVRVSGRNMRAYMA